MPDNIPLLSCIFRHLHQWLSAVFKTLVAALILSSLMSCSKPGLSPLPLDAKILAFGDSLTAGKGVAIENSYPSVLAELTYLEVINAGISGETTSQGVKRFESMINQHQPDLLILIEGGNDILRNQNLAKAKQNLANMIEYAQTQSIQIILIGVPQKKLFSSSAPFYQELADEYQLVFDGDIIASLMRTPSAKSDAVHFNEKGYRMLAQRLYELMHENRAL